MTVDDLQFMTGDWTASVWDGEFEERWSSPIGGTMQGMGRHIVDGKVGFMEFMSIEPTSAGLTMFMVLGAPSKGNKSPVRFVLSEFKEGKAVFSNPKNDYPTRIIYERGSATTLSCRIEGTSSGENKGEDFAFVRIEA